MPQETVGYVRLEWTCKRCGSKNPGTTRICSSCGNVMTETDKFDLPAQQELITDKEVIAKAERGADFQCKYCGARNPADAKNCSQCGADLTGSTQREAGQVMGAFSSVPAPDVKCPYCGAMNPANVLKCKNCAGSLAQRPSDQRDQPKSRPVTASSTKSSGIGKWIGLAVLGVVALFAFLLLRTTDTSASVQSVHWQRSIDVMAQQPVEHETWRDQLPSGAQLGPCTQKVRRTQDNPAPNADKVCGTPYTVDQGNGIGKVVQDCQYQVKDDWCKYTQQEWTVVDAQVAQGDDLKPYDPVPSLIPGQREGNHHETYEVVFSSDGKQYNYSPGDAAEFSRFAPGSRWTLKVNGLGGVVSAEGPK